MPTPHNPDSPDSVGGGGGAPVFPLLVGQVFHLVFSNKTKHDELCLDVREKLVGAGLNVWQQSTDIPRDSDNWFKEWFPNAVQAVKIVCFISADYLRSPFCMKEFRVAQSQGNLLVVACDPLDEIMKVMEEIARHPDASDALAFLMGGGQVIQHGQEDTVSEILKFFPSAAPQTQPEPHPAPEPAAPALGLPPATPAPQLSQIRTLVALSNATQETVEDLLGYIATDLEVVFQMLSVDVISKNRIKREMEGLRAARVESEAEPAEPETEPKPEARRLYVMGGYDGSCLNTAEVYDPQANTWTAIPPMSSKRYGPAAATLVGPDGHPRVYVMGGSDGSSDLNTAEVYNPQTNTWTAIPPMGSRREGAAAAALMGPDGQSRVYVMGGYGVDTAEVYDPHTNTWTAIPPMHSKRQFTAAAALVGPDGQSRVYVMGGFDGSYLNTAEVYDPQANTWTAIPPMSSKRHGPAAATLVGPDGQSRVYVMAGLDGSSYLNTTEVYDPQANTWTAIPPMHSKRWSPAAAALMGPDGQSRLYVVAGRDGSSRLNTAEVYDLQTNTWTAIPPMSSERYGPAAVCC